MTHTAEIVEIFSSLQGEGIYTGTPMTFVRFGRCNMHCNFCDTPQGICHHDFCRVETPPRSEQFIDVPNPVSATKLCELLETFDDEVISVTGGEPLEQASFLSGWLPSQTPTKRILLETNGTHHEELETVLPHVHIVSMDLKLPSSTGCGPTWEQHEAFLRSAIAGGKETYTKIVVTADTTDHDIQQAISMVTKVNRFIPIILQPATPTLTFHNPISAERLKSVERLCHAYLPNVKVMNQMHKEWGVL